MPYTMSSIKKSEAKKIVSVVKVPRLVKESTTERLRKTASRLAKATIAQANVTGGTFSASAG